MKTSVLIVFVLLLSVPLFSAPIIWSIPSGKLERVIICQKTQKKTELLRLYSSGVYEHLMYNENNAGQETVNRTLGRFFQKRKKITFAKPTKARIKGKFNYGTFFFNDGLYAKRAESLSEDNAPIFRVSLEEKYRKPFFLSLKKGTIVFNSEAPDSLNLPVLVQFLTKNARCEEEKVRCLEEFIVKSIEYDEQGFNSNMPVNENENTHDILAGKNRVAICGGYAITLKRLCNLAAISCTEVIGHTKSNFHELSMMAGYHVWNKLIIDGQPQLHDLTWADNGDNIDESWINVAPDLFITSHFPDRREHQLLEKSLNKDEYLNMACVLPLRSGIKMEHAPISGYYFNSGIISLTFHESASVGIYESNRSVLHIPNRLETDDYNADFYIDPFTDYETKKEGDSITYQIKLYDTITPFYIEVDDAYCIKFVAVNGSKKDLMNYYLENENILYGEGFVKALLAAIQLRDVELVRYLTQESKVQIVNEKGEFTLPKKWMGYIDNWLGTLEEMYIDPSRTIQTTKNEVSERDTDAFVVGLPGGFSVVLTKSEEGYSLASID